MVSTKERLWLRLGPARIPIAKFHETEDSLYLIAPFPGVGLHLSVHGSGEIHLYESSGDFHTEARIPPLNARAVGGFLEGFLENVEPDWVPSSDVMLFPAVTSFPGPYLRRVPGGKEFDVLAMLRSWRGEMPIHWVDEGCLMEYEARFAGLHSLVLSPEEGFVGLPLGTGKGYLAFPFDPGDPLGPFRGILEAFPLGEVLEPLFDRGIERLHEYEEEGRGFGALFGEHVTPHTEAIAAEMEEVVGGWEGAQLRLRYPTDWEEPSL